MNNNQEYGYLAEQTFIQMLKERNIPFTYKNDWYDFTIENNALDVKSCRITHKCTNPKYNKQSYKSGRFDFTEEQREKELYIAFFVRHRDNFLFMGISKINKNTKRYISIHQLRELDLLTLDEFINEVKTK